MRRGTLRRTTQIVGDSPIRPIAGYRFCTIRPPWQVALDAGGEVEDLCGGVERGRARKPNAQRDACLLMPATNCENASVSAVERVLVSSFDEQLFVEVWLVRDDQFRQDLDQYEASIGERQEMGCGRRNPNSSATPEPTPSPPSHAFWP